MKRNKQLMLTFTSIERVFDDNGLVNEFGGRRGGIVG